MLTYIFLLNNFGIRIISFKLETRNYQWEKDITENMQEAYYSRMLIITLNQRLEECFGSMSFKIGIFAIN